MEETWDGVDNSFFSPLTSSCPPPHYSSISHRISSSLPRLYILLTLPCSYLHPTPHSSSSSAHASPSSFDLPSIFAYTSSFLPSLTFTTSSIGHGFWPRPGVGHRHGSSGWLHPARHPHPLPPHHWKVRWLRRPWFKMCTVNITQCCFLLPSAGGRLHITSREYLKAFLNASTSW